MGIKTLRIVRPLEKNIEQAFVRWCKSHGITTVKCGVPSWPDRLVFGPGSVFVMIEFKRPGNKLTINQLGVKTLLAAVGFKVHVCHSREEAIDAYREEALVEYEKQRG